jgi:pimeloyl-ACP methyl ester carboxylesterase
MPDQRGFAGSDRPQDMAEYAADKLIDDIFALAEATGVEDFALVGHDWGGAIAWPAAFRNDPRLTKLAIVNAPHPLIFQKSLIEDEEQRAASQYINWFRMPGADKAIEAMGFDVFFQKTMENHVPSGSMPEEERRQYIADWSQPGGMLPMLNWYRASRLIVPPPGATVPLPDFLLRAFPKIHVPTLVVWGMKDSALLPLQLDGLDDLVDDLRIVRLPRVGHFAPWENKSGTRFGTSSPERSRLSGSNEYDSALPFPIRRTPCGGAGALPARDGRYARASAAPRVSRAPSRRDGRRRAVP